MLVRSFAALRGAAAARSSARGQWAARNGVLRCGPEPFPTAGSTQGRRMNSTVVDRTTVYNEGMPPPPPPRSSAAQRLESRPASDFQAFKSTAATQPVAPVPEAEAAAVSEGVDAQTEANRKIFMDAVNATATRNNWTRQEVAAIYYQPVLELAHQAVSVHPTTLANRAASIIQAC